MTPGKQALRHNTAFETSKNKKLSKLNTARVKTARRKSVGHHQASVSVATAVLVLSISTLIPGMDAMACASLRKPYW